MTGEKTKSTVDRYVVFRKFVSETEQLQLISSMITLHILNSSDYKPHNNNNNGNSNKEDSGNSEIAEENDIIKCKEKASKNIFDVDDILKMNPLKETHDFISSHASKSLDLGLKYCGAPFLDHQMLLAIDITRRACKKASEYYNEIDNIKTANISSTLDKMSRITNYTGICLIYGPKSKMTPHYDSPTSHQSDITQEWLVMMTLGNTMLFQMNDKQIQLHTGDLVVMDAMNVLHGVTSIIHSDDVDPALELGLDIPGSRMGILLWQASSLSPPCTYKSNDVNLEDDNEEVFHDLFQDDSSED